MGKPKMFEVQYFDIPLKSEKCKWYQRCEWKSDYRPLIQNAQEYEYFEINANDFDFDAHLEFGTKKEKEKWVIIFAGWNSKKSRIQERKKNWIRQYINTKNEVYQHHTKNQWKAVRGQIKIEILNGAIRISTNENGTWMNTIKPFELKSPEIRREQVTHMYGGVGKAVP